MSFLLFWTELLFVILTGVAIVTQCAGCATNQSTLSEAPDFPAPTNFTVGPWVNRYARVSGLAGVRVQQMPDNAEDSLKYQGKHPAMILYVFSDGRVNQNCFNPDGKLTEDFWFTIKPGDPLWLEMDRSNGSRN